MLEFQAHDSVAVEADGIYRPLHYTISGLADRGVREAILTWGVSYPREVQIPAPAPHPSLCRTWALVSPLRQLARRRPFAYGVTAGSGVEAHFSKAKIAPTLRYTRWAQDPGIPVNRSEFLVGVYL